MEKELDDFSGARADFSATLSFLKSQGVDPNIQKAAGSSGKEETPFLQGAF